MQRVATEKRQMCSRLVPTSIEGICKLFDETFAIKIDFPEKETNRERCCEEWPPFLLFNKSTLLAFFRMTAEIFEFDLESIH